MVVVIMAIIIMVVVTIILIIIIKVFLMKITATIIGVITNRDPSSVAAQLSSSLYFHLHLYPLHHHHPLTPHQEAIEWLVVRKKNPAKLKGLWIRSGGGEF